MRNKIDPVEIHTNYDPDKWWKRALILLFALVIGFIIAHGLRFVIWHTPVASANTVTVSLTVPCTNTNWLNSPRCTAPVADFEVDQLGNATGVLESGVTFTQTRITRSLMLFEMERLRYLVTGYGIIYLD